MATVTLSCGKCARLVYAPPETAGKKVRCPGCGESIAVPADSAGLAEQPASKPCPQCGVMLRLAQGLHGKNVRCKKCGATLAVSADPWALYLINGAPAAPAGPPPSSSRLPAGMPPVPETPETDGTFDFLNSSGGGPASPKALAQAVQNLNVTDMFSGNEKEYVFSLLPGEERLDELTIHHQHVFVVKAGVTRVTLTTHRLLYTATRVFSPVYWLLLVLFPPLILYYVVRMSRNRNVSLPLDSIDSVEKRYRPNWLIFLVAVILGYIVAILCGKAATILSSQLEGIVTGVMVGLLSPVVLVVLLATRIVGIEVRSRNNRFSIRYSPEDRGVSEVKIDAFFQNVHAAAEHARPSQPNSTIV